MLAGVGPVARSMSTSVSAFQTSPSAPVAKFSSVSRRTIVEDEDLDMDLSAVDQSKFPRSVTHQLSNWNDQYSRLHLEQADDIEALRKKSITELPNHIVPLYLRLLHLLESPVVSDAEIEKAFNMLVAQEPSINRIAMNTLLEVANRHHRYGWTVKLFSSYAHLCSGTMTSTACTTALTACTRMITMKNALHLVKSYPQGFESMTPADFGRSIVDQLLSATDNQSMFVDMGALTAMATFYGAVGEWQNAVLLLKNCEARYGATPNTAVYNAVMTVCRQHKRYVRVFKLYNEMKEKEIPRDRITMTIVMASYVDANRLQDAQNLLKEYLETGETIHPNMHTVILSAIASKGGKEEINSFFDFVYRSGVIPEVRSFNSAIAAYLKAKDYDEAIRLFADMHRLRLKPSALTATLMMRCFIEIGFTEGLLGVIPLVTWVEQRDVNVLAALRMLRFEGLHGAIIDLCNTLRQLVDVSVRTNTPMPVAFNESMSVVQIYRYGIEAALYLDMPQLAVDFIQHMNDKFKLASFTASPGEQAAQLVFDICKLTHSDPRIHSELYLSLVNLALVDLGRRLPMPHKVQLKHMLDSRAAAIAKSVYGIASGNGNRSHFAGGASEIFRDTILKFKAQIESTSANASHSQFTFE